MPAWVHPRRADIGERIRRYRRAAKFSQVQLGERVGRDHKTIHRIEHGRSDPPLGLLLLIASAVDVPLSELVR